MLQLHIQFIGILRIMRKCTGLENAVLSVGDGGTYISKGLASTLRFELTQPKDPDPLTDLSVREEQILQLVSEGLTNREIGE